MFFLNREWIFNEIQCLDCPPARALRNSLRPDEHSRSVWGNWCNIARARVGERPSANPRPKIDAYVWVKPPGESDGSSENAPANAPPADRNKKADPTCKYDTVNNIDPLDGAPVAGKWFLKHFENLVRQPGDPVNLGRATNP
jgi:cellulase/cellobiase CelA1